MIETIMYFGIGFLCASLLGLLIIPLVHNRATRLTVRRLEAATPLSIAEIQADKDQLRAEFAISMRRLELTIEELKARSTDQLSELGKKTEAITLLKSEIGEKTEAIRSLEAGGADYKDQLRAIEEQRAGAAAALEDAVQALAKANAELDQRGAAIETQRVEITALKTQVDGLKLQLGRSESQLKDHAERLARERTDAEARSKDLADERGRADIFGSRVAQLEGQLLAQVSEAEILRRRVGELEAHLTQREEAVSQLQAGVDAARQHEADLRAEIAAARGQHRDSSEAALAESTRLQAALAQTTDERTRLEQVISTMKQETDAARASERAETALLRQHITEIAAEVARLTMTLEGPGSPIETILASESGLGRANGAHAGTGDGEQAGGSLADRIRALQSKAARLSAAS